MKHTIRLEFVFGTRWLIRSTDDSVPDEHVENLETGLMRMCERADGGRIIICMAAEKS